MTTTATDKVYDNQCADCREPFQVTASECAARGWTKLFDIKHIGCKAAPRPHRDPFDWSKATAAEFKDMERQARGTENVSR